MTRHGADIANKIMLLGLLASVAVLAMPAAACPIPVYQYSLEWWERDPYEIYVFDTGELTEEQETLVDRLEKIAAGNEDEVPANLRLRRVQSDSEARLRAHSALRGATPESFPWMVVYYPTMSASVRTPVWMGELTAANLDALLESPMRHRISELLLNRTSVVWVLLESGDSDADNQAADLIGREVNRLENTLVPPTLDGFGLDDIEISEIKFEFVRLSRDAADEQMFIEMLVKSEIDLVDYEDQPMLFPIFGRGLIMHALVGRGINPRMIRDIAEFLTGPCSCTVKNANPGVDLLTAVDWGSRIQPMSQEFPDEASGLGGFMDSMDEARDIEP